MKKISEIRRNNLEVAIKLAGGTAEELAEKADVSAVYLSQIKTGAPESKTKKPKAMGYKVAQKIEEALQLEPGWMDVEHSSEQKAANDHPIDQDIYDLAQLIALWHQADAKGKRLIMDLARNAVDPDESSSVVLRGN